MIIGEYEVQNNLKLNVGDKMKKYARIEVELVTEDGGKTWFVEQVKSYKESDVSLDQELEKKPHNHIFDWKFNLEEG